MNKSWFSSFTNINIKQSNPEICFKPGFEQDATNQNHDGHKSDFLSKMSHQYPDTAPNQTTAIDFDVVLLPRTIRWDARADAFAMSAYRLGLTVQQIRRELCMNGYAAFTVEVLESLDRQRVQLMSRVAEPGSTTLRWDARADEFTLAAYQIGQTPVQVLAGLSRAGYEATVEDVVASLHGQGILQVIMD